MKPTLLTIALAATLLAQAPPEGEDAPPLNSGAIELLPLDGQEAFQVFAYLPDDTMGVPIPCWLRIKVTDGSGSEVYINETFLPTDYMNLHQSCDPAPQDRTGPYLVEADLHTIVYEGSTPVVQILVENWTIVDFPDPF